MDITTMLNASENPIAQYGLMDEAETKQQQQIHGRSICATKLS